MSYCEIKFTVSETCNSIEVILANDAKTFQSSREGNYVEHTIVNGKKSWKSMNNAIWYVPKHNRWALGSFDNIGKEASGILTSDGFGDYNPINVPWWWYAKNDEWKPASADDIIFQCVESNY